MIKEDFKMSSPYYFIVFWPDKSCTKETFSFKTDIINYIHAMASKYAYDSDEIKFYRLFDPLN